MLELKFLILSATINVIVAVAKKAAPREWQARAWFKRALSVAPLVIGAAAGLLVLSGDTSSKVQLGILAGALSASAYAVLKKRALKGV